MESLKRIARGLIVLWLCPALASAQVQQPANGGTGTGTAPSAGQILVGQSSGKYAPHTASGSCTINSSGVFSCSGGGGGFGGVNTQTSSYTALSGDSGKIISFNCSTPCSLTLPSPPSSTWAPFVQNIGIAALSIILPGSTTLDGVASTATMNPGMGISIWTDGTNFFTDRGAILTFSTVVPSITPNIAVGYCTGGGCGNSITLPYAVTPGNAIILEMMHSNGGSIAPSDTQADTFTAANYQLVSGQLDANQYVVCNAVGGSTTISLGTTPNFSVVAAYEVTGVDSSSSCIDTKNSAQGNSIATLSTGSITTTVPYDFIFVSGATRTGMGGSTVTESNGYANIYTGCGDANQICYGSFYGVQPAATSVSDVVNVTNSPGGVYAGILALKPATGTAITVGDMIVAGVNGSLIGVHPGTAAYCWISNGSLALPTWQPCPGAGGFPAPVTVSGTSVSELDLTSCIVSGYRDYEIRFSQLTFTAGSSATLLLQFSTNNGSTYDTSTSYFYGRTYTALSPGGSYAGTASQTGAGIVPTLDQSDTFVSGQILNVNMTLYDPMNTSGFIAGHVDTEDDTNGGGIYEIMGGFYYTGSTAVNAVRILAASGGTFTGQATCQPRPQ